MKYGKINNDQLDSISDGFVNEQGHVFWNPTEEQFKDNGFMPIIENRPVEVEGFYISETYEIINDEIKIIYTYVEKTIIDYVV
jgi:hypothetical protein